VSDEHGADQTDERGDHPEGAAEEGPLQSLEALPEFRAPIFDLDFETVESRIDSVESRIDGIKSIVDRLEPGIDHIESRIDRLEPRVHRIEPDVDGIESGIDTIESGIDTIEPGIDDLDEAVDAVVAPALSGCRCHAAQASRKNRTCGAQNVPIV